MEQKKIDRINQLARKAKTAGLTPDEVEEQAALRREYIELYKKNLEAQLSGIVVEEPDGSRRPLKQKDK